MSLQPPVGVGWERWYTLLVMAKLKIAYSHEKEQRVANNFVDKLKSLGRPIPDLNDPAAEGKAAEAVKKLAKAWEPKEEEFINQLNWFYDCDFNLRGWTAHLIRFPICPYWTEEKWFGVHFTSVETQLKIIGHELFHQPFHLFWQEKCEEIFKDVKNPKGAGRNLVVRSLKEALPELLNTPEFKLSDAKDEGHPEPGEQFVRHLICNYYKAYGPFTFKEFLDFVCVQKEDV